MIAVGSAAASSTGVPHSTQNRDRSGPRRTRGRARQGGATVSAETLPGLGLRAAVEGSVTADRVRIAVIRVTDVGLGEWISSGSNFLHQ